MTTLNVSESTTTLSSTVKRLVSTAATTPESLAHEEHAQWCRNCWQHVIDRTLIEWGRNPSAVEDEGVQPPSAESAATAIRVAESVRDDNGLPPLRVVPSGDGGICFERGDRQSYEMIEVCPDGSAEHFTFVKSRLVRRQPFCL